MTDLSNITLSAPIKCTVISCPNFFIRDAPEKKFNFFDFPPNYKHKLIWKQKCGVAANHDVSHAKVCLEHFRAEDYDPVSDKKILQPQAIPKANLDWMFGVPEFKGAPPGMQTPSTEQTVEKTATEARTTVKTATKAGTKSVTRRSNKNGVKTRRTSRHLQRLKSEGTVVPEKEEEEEEPGFSAYFNQIKQSVDENNYLMEHLEKLDSQVTPLKQKMAFYQDRLNTSQQEIKRIKKLINSITEKKLDKGDPDVIGKVFSQAQIDILMRKKKVVWSDDDMAMAFTLRHVGNKKVYLYLKNTLNLPLPSLSSVQRWMASGQQI